MSVPQQELVRIRDLVGRGLNLQAYRLAQSYGRLQDWSGTAAKIVAGRLAYHLGAPRLSHAMHLRAWRADPNDPEARYFAALAVSDCRGPWEAWQFYRKYGPPADSPVQIRTHSLSHRAQLAASLRDFDTAERLLDQADDLDSDKAWVCIMRTYVLHEQDRYAEALDAARQALSLRPDFPQAVAALAQTLISTGNGEQALQVLLDASQETESGLVLSFLAALQWEFDDPRGALTSLQRMQELSPLLEPRLARHLAARLADVHYSLDDIGAAIRYAREVDDGFHRKIADRLERADMDDRRVLLPVDFVKQYHRTCGPATMTAISRFWSKEAEQLDIVEEICYDGTPAHSERSWAERNGWSVREFTVTWDSAVTLLDRGIPFTFTRAGPAEGHLQAVIGYDVRRGTFLIRDPSSRMVVECEAEAALEEARSTGPRGMVMIPADSADLLDGIDLPDSDLWDQAHAIQMALEEHDRSRAHELYSEMSRQHPDDILTQSARRALAAYDADALGLLAFADHMLQRFPDDPRWQYAKHAHLSELGRENEGLALLREICRQGGAHPRLLQAYAQDLSKDAREHGESRRIMRRLLTSGLVDAECLHTLGDLDWSARDFDQALELYRFAACLGDKDERFAQSYFLACSYLDRSDEGEEFLRRRVERLGRQSPGPLVTLHETYQILRQPALALEVLEDALKLHADDPNFLVLAARIFDSLGQKDRAEELLARAKPVAKDTIWLRASAELATRRGDFERALEFWRRILEFEPLALDANAEFAKLLASLHGPREAMNHLATSSSRFPNNVELQKLRVNWLLQFDRAAAESALRELIEVASVNTWARWQLAMILGERGDISEAQAEAKLASLLDPNDPAPHYVRGRLLQLCERPAEASDAYREAIGLSLHTGGALQGLFAVCRSDDERRHALDFLREEIVRQLSVGEAPLVYWHHAQNLYQPEELLEDLRRLLQTRPGHRRSWSILIRQLVSMDRHEQAGELIDQFVERFPLDVQTWIEASELRGLARDTEGEARALRRALRIDPANGDAYRGLSEVARVEGRTDDMLTLLEEAVAAAPLDPLNHGYLASLLWERGRRQEALSRVEIALNLDQDYEWGWSALGNWSNQIGEPDRALTVARDLTRRRAGEVDAWLRLAAMLEGEQHAEEKDHALKKALDLDPLCVAAHDQRAVMLAEAGRFAEALEACRSQVWPDDPPLPLRGRVAWIKAQQGDLLGAINQMQALVDKDRDYEWGWRQLADWHRERGANRYYLEASLELIRVAPNNSWYLCNLGHAQLLNEDREAATQAFRRAFELVPGLEFAGRNLFLLQLDALDFHGAALTVNEMRRTVSPGAVLAMQIKLASAQNDATTMDQNLGDLFRMADVPESDLTDAANSAYARWAALTNRHLGQALDDTETHPVVGDLWIRAFARDRHWRACEKRIASLDPDREITRRAQMALLECMVEAEETSRLRRYVSKHREQLHADTRLWGATLNALAMLRRWSVLVKWAGTLKGREGIEPWMLANLATGLRALGRFDEAKKANERSFMLPADHSSREQALWLALEEALQDETRVAQTWLAQFPEAQFDERERFLFGLARGVLELQHEDQAGGMDRFKSSGAILAEARANCPDFGNDVVLRRALRRCLRHVARKRGGVRGALWYVKWLEG